MSTPECDSDEANVVDGSSISGQTSDHSPQGPSSHDPDEEDDRDWESVISDNSSVGGGNDSDGGGGGDGGEESRGAEREEDGEEEGSEDGGGDTDGNRDRDEEGGNRRDSGPSPTRVRARGRYVPTKPKGAISERRFTREYISLLNSEILRIKSGAIYSDEFPAQEGSQVIGSRWSAAEQDIFFDRLALHGRGGVKEITKAVRTKSEVEVTAYLRELSASSVKAYEYLRDRGRGAVTAKAIPAAVELSEACVEELAAQASEVEKREGVMEATELKKEWGESYNIDMEMARQITQYFNDGDVDTLESLVPEAELLNVERMLELSELLFMNGPGEANYRTISDDRPSIWYPALMDFHRLVVSITRRTISSTIFVAERRIAERTRGKEEDVRGIQKPASEAITHDVFAALRVLGMSRNRLEHFVQIPRVHGLKVVADMRKLRENLKPPVMAYEEVEAHLGTITGTHVSRYWKDVEELTKAREVEADAWKRAAETRETSPSKSEADADARLDDSDSARQNQAETLKGSATDPGTSSCSISEPDEDLSSSEYDSDISVLEGGPSNQEPSVSQLRRRHRVQRAEDAEEAYLEELDCHNSLLNEHELWNDVIKLAPPRNLPLSPDPNDLPEPPRAYAPLQRSGRSTINWRDETVYRPEWDDPLLQVEDEDEEEAQIHQSDEGDDEGDDEGSESDGGVSRSLSRSRGGSSGSSDGARLPALAERSQFVIMPPEFAKEKLVIATEPHYPELKPKRSQYDWVQPEEPVEKPQRHKRAASEQAPVHSKKRRLALKKTGKARQRGRTLPLNPSPKRSPRKQRKRQRSSAPPGFVPTVEAVEVGSDAEHGEASGGLSGEQVEPGVGSDESEYEG